MSEDDLDACYQMVYETSGEDYRNSADGWNETAKRTEMKSDELKYILVEISEEQGTAQEVGEAPRDPGKGRLRGFLSMMPTFENGEPVMYCYEVHVQPYLQGSVYPNWSFLFTAPVLMVRNRTGLAQLLMKYILQTAANIPNTEKTMLTCFVSNKRGRRFYERLGFEVDESSPKARRLRSGKTITSDYEILSKRTESAGSNGGRIARQQNAP